MARKVKQINLDVGRRIRAAREKRKMSRETLAESCEITPRFLADIERGTVGPSLSTLRRICEVLGITSDSLLWGGCAAEDAETARLAVLLNSVEPKYHALLVDGVERDVKLLRRALADKEAP